MPPRGRGAAPSLRHAGAHGKPGLLCRLPEGGLPCIWCLDTTAGISCSAVSLLGVPGLFPSPSAESLSPSPVMQRYSAAITSALSKVNEAVLTARVADAHQQLSEASQCSICMSFPRDTALNCGHVICNGCSHRVSQCPICRAEISNRTRIFV